MTKTLTTKATELSTLNVNIVSMVKRGANRIPFRIVKEDTDDMLDLHKIAGQAFAKTEDKKGGVFAVIVNKSADVAALQVALADTGLKLEKGEEGEGTIVFKQEGVDEFDVGLVKLDDEVIVAVSGLKKGFSSYNWQDTDFATVFATEGFYPSLRTATEAFSSTVSNILYKEENKSSITTKVSKALTDFGSLVNTLVNNIPEAAIKADEILKSDEYTSKKKPAAAAADPKATDTKKDEGKTDPAATVKTDETKPVETVKDETKPEGTEAVKTDPVVTPPAADDMLAKIGDMISASLAKAIEPVTASVDALKNDLTSVTAKVEEVSANVQKTDKVLKGTVIASSTPDRTASTTKKSESEVAPPPLDTAYGRP
ncbi:hypothetical protein EVC30_150 [Rhizobium phage RHph_Y1_11]|nr:hypothetical protein EVC30_150 [Rhizobium phage RHph_Y1_11]